MRVIGLQVGTVMHVRLKDHVVTLCGIGWALTRAMRIVKGAHHSDITCPACRRVLTWRLKSELDPSSFQ